ncbi:MAG: aminoacyl-tRNA hydrolase [Hymenobacteraceae bacterium]|nr:aminoacyl-tRNA hydrolase [Hymenobacteraceae bacterium]
MSFPSASAFLPEIIFQTSRASGPGGQNVNKVESRVEARFTIAASALLTAEQKERILEKLAARLTTEGELLVVAQDDRSQLRNKEIVVARLHAVLVKALHRDPPRKATTPGKGAVRRRLESKKKLSEKKANRRPDF